MNTLRELLYISQNIAGSCPTVPITQQHLLFYRNELAVPRSLPGGSQVLRAFLPCHADLLHMVSSVHSALRPRVSAMDGRG
jgi:hypothetical protein